MSKKEREIYNANSKWTVRSLFFFFAVLRYYYCHDLSTSLQLLLNTFFGNTFSGLFVLK